MSLNGIITKQVVTSALRWGMSALGGIIISKGYLDGEQVEQLAGAVLSLFSLGWSALHHTKNVSLPKSDVKKMAAAKQPTDVLSSKGRAAMSDFTGLV